MTARCRRHAKAISDPAVQRELRTIASRCEHLAEKIESEQKRDRA